MKKLNLCILVVVSLLFATNTSLGTDPIKAKDYVLLTIKVAKARKVKILIEDYSLYDPSEFSHKKVMINPDGIFIDTVRAHNNAKIIQLYYYAGGPTGGGPTGGGPTTGMLPLYLKGKEDLYVTLTYTKNNAHPEVTFKGEYAKECDYMAKKSERSRVKMGMRRSIPEVFGLSEKEYIAKIRKETDELIDLAKNSGLSPEFLKGELRWLEYEYYSSLSSYESMHGEMVNDRNYRTSPSFPSFADDPKMDKNNPEDYRLSRDYRWLITDYFTSKIFKNESFSLSPYGGRMYRDYTLRMLRGIPNTQAHEVIKNGILYSVVKDSLDYADNLEQLYAEFMKASTDKQHKERITSKYEKLLKTKKGVSSPKFVNYENHKGGTLSLDDLKGKYVFIDIWATWCAPCIAEIPSLERLEKKYHNKNIAFVSISIDKKSDHKKWKDMVTKKNMGGIQLFADKSFDSEFVKSYNIPGIPYFILLDPDGKIIKGNAPRPSDPSLDRLLSKLLN